jgi:hypothetical protein
MDFANPATSSGHDSSIFRANSCCLESSLTLRDLSTLARILLYIRPGRLIVSSSLEVTSLGSVSLGYQPLSLKQIPVPGRVQIANKK